MITIIKNNEVKHIKTGKIYRMYQDDAICSTNSNAGTRLVIYTDGITTFVRDYNEFYEKFKLMD